MLNAKDLISRHKDALHRNSDYQFSDDQTGVTFAFKQNHKGYEQGVIKLRDTLNIYYPMPEKLSDITRIQHDLVRAVKAHMGRSVVVGTYQVVPEI